MIRIVETDRELIIHTDSDREDKMVRRLLTTARTNQDGSVLEVIRMWHSEDPIRTLRGYKDYLLYHLEKLGYECELEEFKPDLSSIPDVNPRILDDIELYDFQQIAVRKALLLRRGVIVSPVGSGKTIMAMALMKHHGLPSIIVVPSTYLEDQFYSRMKEFGFDVVKLSDCSVDYILKRKPPYIIGVFKSVRNIVSHLDKSYYRCLIMDEYHHGQATTWRDIYYNLFGVDYAIGFTGTLYRDFDFDYRDLSKLNYQDFIMMGLSTKVIFNVSYKTLIDRGILAQPIVYIHPIKSRSIPLIKSWNIVFKRSVENSKVRNSAIIDFVVKFFRRNKVVMVLSSTLNHIMNIANMIPADIREYTRIYKGNRTGYYWNDVRWVPYTTSFDEIEHMLSEGRLKVILATTVFNEGIDLPSVDALILAFSGKAFTRTMQMVGRVIRRREDKDRAYIVDFYDTSHHYLKSQSEKRVRMYHQSGFKVVFDEDLFWNIVDGKHEVRAP